MIVRFGNDADMETAGRSLGLVPGEIPAVRVGLEVVTEQSVEDLATSFGFSRSAGGSVEQSARAMISRNAHGFVGRFSYCGGGVVAAHRSGVPKLRSLSDVRAMREDFWGEAARLAVLGARLNSEELIRGGVGLSCVSLAKVGGCPGETQFDSVHLRFFRRVQGLLVIGGGGKADVRLSNAGEMEWFSFVWRPVLETECPVRVLRPEQAIRRIASRLEREGKDGRLRPTVAAFGYYEAGRYALQERLLPAYMFGFEEDRRVPKGRGGRYDESTEGNSRWERTRDSRTYIVPAASFEPEDSAFVIP